ncbi:unnamed protein product [Oppiella nova]|uniref:Uncharacterized protein n=1 Tax=Oppiella nova TaxID=334625 RepID=A0A7R9LMZ2_9ACAR|nr:unnamed protein product [Oppiella nova]CAG2165219.1 unnamed protein product [Oppiella nova]
MGERVTHSHGMGGKGVFGGALVARRGQKGPPPQTLPIMHSFIANVSNSSQRMTHRVKGRAVGRVGTQGGKGLTGVLCNQTTDFSDIITTSCPQPLTRGTCLSPADRFAPIVTIVCTLWSRTRHLM